MTCRLAATALWTLAACTASDDATRDETTSSSTSSGSGSTGPTSAVDTGEGSSTTGPIGDGILQCVETCTVPSDCCLPGTPCPGAYPNNVDCVDALCVAPRCVDDTDCETSGPGTVCTAVRGSKTCVLPCTDDVPCTAAVLGTCAGLDDQGAGFCFARCDAPGQFCGNQICDAATGLCTCASDGNCQSDWRCLD